MPTTRNARGIEIIVYHLEASEYVGIQVKSFSKKNPVPLGGSLDKVLGDFWIIVNNRDAQHGVFVMTPAEVKERAHRGDKDGKISFWLQPRSYMLLKFEGAWGRIRGT